MNENSTSRETPEQQDRWFDLLIQRATSGLSMTEQQELDQLAFSFDNQHEIDQFEATAAAFDLSISSIVYEAMPNEIHDRLLISAGRFLGEKSPSTVSASVSAIDRTEPDSKVERSGRNDTTMSVRWREIVSLLVAAASLMLILSGYNPFSGSPDVPIASAFEKMDKFMASAPSDLVNVDWVPVDNQTASGKVIWSDSRQEGYMVFSGMNENDPSIEQYQLWVFNDPKQETPTDGGVFNISTSDIGPDGNIVIPINPTVPVDHAVQFAVTVEKPGGVYVSERKTIPVLAKIESPD